MKAEILAEFTHNYIVQNDLHRNRWHILNEWTFRTVNTTEGTMTYDIAERDLLAGVTPQFIMPQEVRRRIEQYATFQVIHVVPAWIICQLVLNSYHDGELFWNFISASQKRRVLQSSKSFRSINSPGLNGKGMPLASTLTFVENFLSDFNWY